MNVVTLGVLKSTFCAADHYGKAESKLLGFINDSFRNVLAVKTFPPSKSEQHRLLNLQEETMKKASGIIDIVISCVTERESANYQIIKLAMAQGQQLKTALETLEALICILLLQTQETKKV